MTPSSQHTTSSGGGKASLAGRVALVTGAGRRVGKAIALELAARGAEVIVHYRSGAKEAEAVVAEIVGGGGAAVAIAADLGDPAAGRRLVEEASAWRGGRLDVLVNSASPFQRVPFVGGDDAAWEAAWQESLDVTLRAPARLARHAAAALARSNAPGGGVVVNIVDIAAWQAWPSYAHHGAAKAGLVWLTKTLAVALGPAVRCAGVAPGIVEWPESMAEEAQRAQRERLLAKVPLGRAGSAADVAGAVAYVCEAAYVNGTVIVVDGGRLAQTGEGG